jgi:hypothetical protein
MIFYFLFLILTSCSSNIEYISKIDSVINIEYKKNKNKIYLYKISYDELLNSSYIKNKIEKEIKNKYTITYIKDEADFLIKINPILTSENITPDFIEKLKYYTILNSINQSIYYDNSNAPKLLNEKNIFDVQSALIQNKLEEKNDSSIGITSLIGASSGYLISHSLFGAATGAIALMPIFYGSRYISEKRGVIAIYEVIVSEKLDKAINITERSIIKNSTNSITEYENINSKTFYKKSISKIIIAGIANRYSLDTFKDKASDLLSQKILSFFE